MRKLEHSCWTGVFFCFSINKSKLFEGKTITKKKNTLLFKQSIKHLIDVKKYNTFGYMNKYVGHFVKFI